MSDYDAIIIGAGHNGLICAGYLAQAGKKVLVVERRHRVGGAVVTEEIVPGFKFDLGGSAHILIHHTPIVQDLRLAEYGLEYLDLDPLFFAPFPDGRAITLYKDLDRTCENIAQNVSEQEAEAYRRFIELWRPLAEATVETFCQPPTPWNVGKNLIYKSGLGGRNWERLTDIFRGYGQLLRQSFAGEELPALIGWMAAQSGPPPTEPLSAPFALWHPMYHVSGMKRPRGGSGQLTQALARMIEAHGGTILTNAPAQKILVLNGRAAGVQITHSETGTAETFTAPLVISGAHIHTTLKMVAGYFPEQTTRMVQNSRIGNGFGMILRCAMDELPNYTATSTPRGEIGEEHIALQFICPSLDYLDAAYGDYLTKRPSADPALIGMTFSAADPTLAPPGKHTLFVWGQYYPYELADREDWDEIQEREAGRMLDVMSQYAPNVKSAVIDKLIETPLYLERELGLLRGNVMHLEMSIDQMFMLRPIIGMSDYRTPIEGLYLTGASTHPGGGIMGASGRNAAQTILHDTRPRWWQGRGARSEK